MALSSYKHANSKLDEQLYKLKTAKSEMNQLFQDIDKLIDSDEDDTQNYSFTNIDRKSYDNDHHDTNPYEKFEPNIFYSSDEERSCSCKSEYRLSDELSDANEYYEEKPSLKPRAKIRYVYRSNEIDQSRKSTDFNYGDFDLEQLIRSAENIESIQRSNMLTNEEKLQYTYLLENMKTHDSHYKKYESSRNKASTSTNNRKSVSSSSTKRNSLNSKSSKNRSTYQHKPSWAPAGKIKNANIIYRSSSSINKNSSNPMYRSTSSINKVSHFEQKSNGPLWRPSANIRPKSALYYSSSQDLKKAEHLSRKVSQSKDIGNGWRPASRLETDLHIYYSDTISTDSKEHKNKKIDSQDTGKVWKPNGRIKTDHKIVFSSDPRTDDKKGQINEKKDIGSGWKAVGKLKEENFFKTDPAYVRIQPLTVSDSSKENKASKSHDVGQGWKPALKVVKKNIKFGMSYSKPPVPSSSNKTEAKKEPSVPTKNWTPSPKLKAVYPNTWLPEKDKKKEKPISSKLSKLTKYKQRINMLTSTPNTSQRDNHPSSITEKPHLNESVINDHVETIQKSSSRANSILEKSIHESLTNERNNNELDLHHSSKSESINRSHNRSRPKDTEKTLLEASNKLEIEQCKNSANDLQLNGDDDIERIPGEIAASDEEENIVKDDEVFNKEHIQEHENSPINESHQNNESNNKSMQINKSKLSNNDETTAQTEKNDLNNFHESNIGIDEKVDDEKMNEEENLEEDLNIQVNTDKEENICKQENSHHGEDLNAPVDNNKEEISKQNSIHDDEKENEIIDEKHDTTLKSEESKKEDINEPPKKDNQDSEKGDNTKEEAEDNDESEEEEQLWQMKMDSDSD